MIITLTNVSFASFPVTLENVISIDTIKADTNKIVVKETTADFHSRLEKEGFDVDNCQCKDCRRFKGSYIKEKEDRYSNSRKYFATLGAGVLILVLILVVSLTLWIVRGIMSLGTGTWNGL
tara:strand:- start:770 stop:1132 length:363 start_codon:yes stop_codon:yes gene_type:complete